MATTTEWKILKANPETQRAQLNSVLQDIWNKLSEADRAATSAQNSSATLSTLLDDPDSGLRASADAIRFTTSRVFTLEGTTTAIAEDVTALDARVDDLDTTTSGNSSAINALTARVDINEGDIAATATDVTALETAVYDPSTGLAATSDAVNTLESRVTVNEGAITSTASDVTTLTSRVDSAETDINNIETVNSGQATAISGLDTRVTSAEGAITATASDVTALDARVDVTETDINGLETTVSGQSSAITSLDTRVTNAEGTLTSQASDITSLQSSVALLPTVYLQDTMPIGTSYIVGDMWLDSNDGNKVHVWDGSAWGESVDLLGATIYAQPTAPGPGALRVGDTWFDTDDGNRQYRWNGTTWADMTDSRLTANASAISSLDTRVTTAEGTITAHGTSITTLQADLTSAEDDISANSSAITSLDTRVTSAEGNITSNSSDITTLENTVFDVSTGLATKASTTAVNALDSRVTSAEGTITSQGNAITSLDSRVDTAEADILTKASASALSALDTRVTSAEGTITSQGSAITSLDSRLDTAEGEIDTKADATAMTALDTRVTAAEGDITSQSSSITTLENNVRLHKDAVFRELFPAGSIDLYTLGAPTTAEIVYQASAESEIGGNTVLIGNNAGDDDLYLIHNINRFDFDPTKMYRLRARVKRISSSGTNRFYAGFQGRTAGGAGVGGNMYLVNAVTPVIGQWTTYEKFFKGHNAGTTMAGAGTLASPFTMPASLAKLCPLMLIGWSNVSGQYELDYFIVEEATAEEESYVNATAISALDSRVDVTETTITSQGSSITSLDNRLDTAESDITGIEGNVSANTTAITGLDTRVTAAEGTITSQSSSITSLDSRLDTAESDITAIENVNTSQATALTSLDTRVTSAEGNITSQSTAITALDARVDDTESDIASNASAISTLTTTVTQHGTNIAAVVSDVDALEAGIGAILGPELVPNWQFEDGITGTIASGVTRSATDGELLVTANDPSENRVEWLLTGAMEIGATYRFRTRARLGTSTTATIKSFVGATIAPTPITSTSYQEYGFTFTATSTDLRIRIYANQAGATLDTIYLDWVSVKKVTNTAVADAVNALDVRVAQNETDITATASDVTTLETAVNHPSTGLAAVNTAVSSLDSRVDAAEGTITAQGSSITSLDSRLDTAEADITAIESVNTSQASAITSLDTRVTNTENTNTSQATSITNLNSSVSTAQSTADAKGKVIYSSTAPAVADRLSQNLWIDTTGSANTPKRWNGSAWVAVTDKVATDAAATASTNATAITSLDTRVTSAEGVNTSQGSSITSLQNTINDPSTGLATKASTSALNTLETKVNTKTTTFVQTAQPSTTGRTVGDQWIDTDDNNKLYVWSGSAWTLRPDQTKISVFVQTTKPSLTGRATGDLWFDSDDSNKQYRFNGSDFVLVADTRIAANATAITQLQSDVATKASASALSALDTRVTSTENTNTAQASSITQLQTDVAGKASASVVTAIDARVSTVEQGGKGVNLLTNSTFSLNVSGWTATSSSGLGTFGRDSHGFVWQPTGMHALVMFPVNTGALNSAYFYVQQIRPCVTGQRYCASAYLAAHRGNVFAYIYFMDENGADIGSHFITPDTAVPQAGKNLATDYGRVHIFGTAPATARQMGVAFGWRKSVESPAGDNPYVWIIRPMVEEATATQTAPSPWNSGGTEAFASATMTLDVNGYQTGWAFANDGAVGAASFNADYFNIIKPGGGNSLTWTASDATLVAHNATTGKDLKMGPSFGADTDKLVIYYGPDVANASATLADSVFGITQSGKPKFGGTGSNYASGWSSGGTITSDYDSSNPSIVTFNVAAGTFKTNGVSISYNAGQAQVSQARSTTVKYYLYYNDPGMSGGTKTLQVSTSANVTFENTGYILIAGPISVTVTAIGGGSGPTKPPNCVSVDTPLPEYSRAGDVKLGDLLVVGNASTGRVSIGRVSASREELQECVLFVTENGWLQCSRSAPIAIAGGTLVNAGDLTVGTKVPRQLNGIHGLDTILYILDVGLQPVQYISCENDTFLAGNGCYYYHHNTKGFEP